jgi:hypothetical protein
MTMRAARRLSLKLPVSLFLFSLALLPRAMHAQDFDAGARALAEKIAARAGPRGTVSLEVRNLSSLSVAQTAAVKATLEAGLREHGATLVAAPPADSEVRVTLAENVQGYLWVAEVRRGPATQVAMILVPRSASEATASAAPGIVLHKQLVLVQATPVQDVKILDAPWGGSQWMAVLQPDKFSLYEKKGADWGFMQDYPLAAAKPWPRDLRGRVFVHIEGGDVRDETLLWVTLADSAWVLLAARTSHTLLLEPEKEQEPCYWILDAEDAAEINASRNFFTGRICGENGERMNVLPFFSFGLTWKESSPAAEQQTEVFANLDGRARLFQRIDEEPFAIVDGLGSELATVQTKCGGGWQVLTTRPGDWTEADAIQAYEIRDHQLVPVGAAVDVPGPVMSLDDSGIAVVRNLKTGKYEAYNITITCGH